MRGLRKDGLSRGVTDSVGRGRLGAPVTPGGAVLTLEPRSQLRPLPQSAPPPTPYVCGKRPKAWVPSQLFTQLTEALGVTLLWPSVC